MPQFISTSQQIQQTPSCQFNPASPFQSFKPANPFSPVKKPSLVPCWLVSEIHTPQPGTNPSTYNQSPNCCYNLIPCYSAILWPKWKQTSFAHLYALICLSDFCHFSRLFSNAFSSMEPHWPGTFLSFRLHCRLLGHQVWIYLTLPWSLLLYLSILEASLGA